MAAVEKLKLADSTHKAFKSLDGRIGNYLEKLNMHFTDEGNCDEGRADADEARTDGGE